MPDHDGNISQPAPRRKKLTGERLERRRRTDREAQRAGRARTKNRITQLEGTIESLLSSHGEGVESLARQLKEERRENQRLREVLMNIGNSITAAVPQGSAAAANDHVSSRMGILRILGDADEIAMNETVEAAFSQGADSQAAAQSILSVDTRVLLPDNLEDIGSLGNPMGLDHARVDEFCQLPENHEVYKVMIGANTLLRPKNHGKALWEIVSDALCEAKSLRSELTALNGERDVDIAIRAVLHGWASVQQVHVLDLGWQLLRRIDQGIFCHCGPIERLAILRVMRLTLLREANPQDDIAALPSFMASRPTQMLMKHPDLVDYFVWPELRDHLILTPQRFLPERFARLFSSSIRFTWPSSLHDVCTINDVSGLYSFSELFDGRFQDIKCWTLCFDFFASYPELIGVVPIYDIGPDRPRGGWSLSQPLEAARNGEASNDCEYLDWSPKA